MIHFETIYYKIPFCIVQRVIGIISEHYRSQSDVDNNLSFAIPVSSIIKVFIMLTH